MELKADRLNNQQLKTVESSTRQRQINPGEANRMMQRMGMQVKQVVDVTRVIIKSASKRIVIDNPEVAIVLSRDRRSTKLVEEQPGKKVQLGHQHRKMQS